MEREGRWPGKKIGSEEKRRERKGGGGMRKRGEGREGEGISVNDSGDTPQQSKKMRFLLASPQKFPTFYPQNPLTSVLVPRLCRAGVM